VFAARLGCAVPELYWTGRFVARVPLDRLPDRFVVKPPNGTSAARVFLVNGQECRTENEHFPRRELANRLHRSFLPFRLRPLIVEELITNAQGEPSFDYKFYVFRDRIGAILVVDRRDGHDERKTGVFTPEWEPRSPIRGGLTALGDVPRPACLDEMSRLAIRCGKAWDTFVRVDFYLRGEQCVFGEFSSCPHGGNRILPEADEHLGRLWQEMCPDRE
jgi:hypothetical protein